MMVAVDVRLTPPEGLHVEHRFDNAWPQCEPMESCTVCGIPNWQALQELRDAGSSKGTPAHDRLPTVAADTAQRYADRIHAAFNEDDSDIMTDYFSVKFYGQVATEGDNG